MDNNSQTVARRFLSTGEAYTTVLTAIVLDTYGGEAYEWSPETLRLELQDDFHVQIHPAAFDRIMAGAVLLTSDVFYKKASHFVELCNVLSGSRFDPTSLDLADVDEIAWGVTEALLLNPPEEEEPFSPEVQKYIGVMIDAEGIINPPDVLRLGRLSPSKIVEDVNGVFADDPAMFAAIYDVERGKTEEINRAIREGLHVLLHQLSQLRLQNGSTEDLLRRLSKEK